MSGTSITIDDREVRAALSQLDQRLDDMRPALREIGQAIDTHTQLAFRAGKDPFGKPWAKLKKTTRSRRRQGSDRPLRDTGRLQNSFSAQLDGKHAVEYGTDAIYAGTHQYGARKGQYGRTSRGGPIPWGNIPARPMLPEGELPETLKREFLRITAKHLDR